MDKKGKGVSRSSIENFLSHSAENLRRDSFTVALVSGSEKFWIGGGSIKIIRPFFCLTVSKISVGESLTVDIKSGCKIVYGQEGGRE